MNKIVVLELSGEQSPDLVVLLRDILEGVTTVEYIAMLEDPDSQARKALQMLKHSQERAGRRRHRPQEA